MAPKLKNASVFDTLPKYHTSSTDEIIGLPPVTSDRSQLLFSRGMPILEITPSRCEFKTGLELFKLIPAMDEYNTLLEDHGFKLKNQKGPIKIAFTADSPLSESYNNEYGENFLSAMTDIASGGINEIAQMMNARQGSTAITQAIKSLKDQKSNISNMLGGGLEAAESGAKQVAGIINGASGNKLFGSQSTMDALFSGARIDFPFVWKNSNFSNSYSFNVKLYNPNPSSEADHMRFIVGPMAIILCMILPRTEDGATYNWPFFHKLKCKGLFNIESGMITNVSITKGGDANQIGYNQRIGMIDVRMDIGILYKSMVAGSQYQSSDRPTLKMYLESLKDERKLDYVNPEDPFSLAPNIPIINSSTYNSNVGTLDNATNTPSSRVPNGKNNEAKLLGPVTPAIV